MIIVGQVKFEDLDRAYEVLVPVIQEFIKGNAPILRIYNNFDLIYDSTSKNNPLFYTSRGVKGDLMEAFIKKYQGKNGIIKWKEDVLMKF